MDNNMIFAFVFDSGKLGGFYGEVVFEAMLSGNELSNNKAKMIVSWGDILIQKRHIDIEPYIFKDNYCTIDFDELNSKNPFKDYPFCWIIEDLDKDLAMSLDKRLKSSMSGYAGMSRIDPSSSSEKKQFWKRMLRDIAIHNKTIICFQDPDLTDQFCYLEKAIELGYEVKYDSEAEYGDIEYSQILQTSFVTNNSDLAITPQAHSDIDRNILMMNFALRQELQISGTLIWKSINDIDNIQFSSFDNANDHLIEYSFLALYHASQGIERIQKAIIELICKKNHIAEDEKVKVYELLYSHSHDKLTNWIEEKEQIKFNSNCRNLIGILVDFYNTVRYVRYSDEGCEETISPEYNLLLKLSTKNTTDIDFEIKNNFGKFLGELSTTYFNLYYKLCHNLGIFAYELEYDSDASIVYYYRKQAINLYKEFQQRKQAKKELLYWLIKNGNRYPYREELTEDALDFEPEMIDDYLSELVLRPESVRHLYDAVDDLYDELCSEDKQKWKNRLEFIDYFIANSEKFF